MNKPNRVPRRPWSEYIDNQASTMYVDYKKFIKHIIDNVPSMGLLPEGNLADALEERIVAGKLCSVESDNMEYLLGLPEKPSSKSA